MATLRVRPKRVVRIVTGLVWGQLLDVQVSTGQANQIRQKWNSKPTTPPSLLPIFNSIPATSSPASPTSASPVLDPRPVTPSPADQVALTDPRRRSTTSTPVPDSQPAKKRRTQDQDTQDLDVLRFWAGSQMLELGNSS